MQDFEPLIPSFEELDRRLRAGRQLRSDYLFAAVSAWRGRVRVRRGRRLIGASVAASAIAVAVFWAALLGSPKVTEAGVTDSGVDPEKVMLSVPRDLPSFDDTHQRHTGVLDVLKPY
jgi:hypothetical protein